MKVEFFRHNLTEEDIARAAEVLRSVFLTTGREVRRFEEKFAACLGVPHCVGVTSCTAALHLCLLAWGVGEGDEVITTPMTFCATANAILHAGATPVFADVSPDTGNLDPDLIEAKVTGRTRAVLPVHLYGRMCDMEKIRAVADRHGLFVFEDAAHCVEGDWRGIRPGALGDAACFSFYATKAITSGEGGAVATRSAEKAALISSLRSHGMDVAAADRYTGTFRHWDMPVLGLKCNMDNIQAALLLGQVDRMQPALLRRAEIAARYDAAFRDLPGIRLLAPMDEGRHAWHLYTIRVPGPGRDAFLSALQAMGVGVAVNYRPVHLLRFYRERFGFREGAFPVAEALGAETVSLPLYSRLTDAEVGHVIDAVGRAAKKLFSGG